jgi:hypothetical protein
MKKTVITKQFLNAKKMKNLLIISLFFCFVTIGCANKEIAASKKLGENFQLKANETVNLSDNSSLITVKLINIQDSRCPKNVQCIRAGEAIVMLDLQIGTEKFNGLKVCIGCEKEMDITESTEIKVNTKTYILKLNSVDPYPQSTGLSSPTATLVIN